MTFMDVTYTDQPYIVIGLMTLVILVLVLANCVCAGNKHNRDDNDEGVNGTGAKEKAKKLKKSKRHNGTTSNGDIELRVATDHQRNSHGSNGSVCGDARPKSHDGNRALPEIPNGEASSNMNFHPYATVPGEQDSQTYAAVNDPDYAGISTDTASETYSRVKDTDQAPNSSIIRQSKNSHPYAEVSNIGEATYAQISEKPQSTKRKTVSSTISTDTIDSVNIPPVPDKTADLLECGSNRSSSAINAGSPNLPPRNSVLDSASIPYADEGSPQHQMYDVSSMNSSHSSNQGAKKKDPPYDDITARESLSHIRERQAIEESHVASGASGYRDLTYDREYDEIKSVPCTSRGNRDHRMQMPAAGDRNSLASDTYAEIWQSDQAVGLRQSSMYCKVQEVETSHAPTPPPIDTLKQLSHSEGASGVIVRQRPVSTGSSTYNTVADVDVNTQGKSQPVYAVPNKRDKRVTVHGDMQQPQAAANTTEHLYSKVNKPKNNKAKDKKVRHSNYDNIVNVDTYAQQGARPKQRTHDSNRNVDSNSSQNPVLSPSDLDKVNRNSPKTSDKRVTPGYQTIGSVGEYSLDGVDDDPDYDTVQEGAVVIPDQYDVDYESLPGSAAAVAARASINVPNNHIVNRAPVATDDGNANSLTVSNPDRNANPPRAASLVHISQHRPRSQGFARREHIYEVITDQSHENIYTADPTRHITSRKVKIPQQFVTNL